MFFEAKLVFKNYVPEGGLERGMLFMHNMELIELGSIPKDEDAYIKEHGYPVELYIVDDSNPNYSVTIIATPEQIAWMDEGDHSDELSDISLEQLNYIIQQYEGELLYEVDIVISDGDDEEPYYTPLLIDNKVVIRLLSDDSQQEEMENPEYLEEEQDNWYPTEDDI